MVDPGARLVLLVALVALLPLASAQQARYSLASTRPVQLAGGLEVGARGAVGRVASPVTSGVVRLQGLDGELTVSTWRALVVSTPESPKDYPYQDAQVERYRLANGSIQVRLDAENFDASVVAEPGGWVGAAGSADAWGFPEWLSTPFGDDASGAYPTRLPDGFSWSMPAGWAFVGREPGDPTDRGAFPSLAPAEVRLHGPVQWLGFGGNATVALGNGSSFDVRSGTWREEPVGASPIHLESGPQVLRRLVFRGAVENGSLPAGSGFWGVAAPALSWSLDGVASWTHASGSVEVDGRETEVRDADVTLRGASSFTPAAPAATDPTARTGYGGASSGALVEVDGVPLASGPGPGPAPAEGVGVSVLVLALALATKAGRHAGARLLAALYSRLSRRDVEESPRRREILAAIRERPGLHARELQRAVGGGWGALQFHLALLERHGLVARRAVGGFSTFFAAGAPPAHPVLARLHGATLRVFEELPLDGAPVPVARLQASLGISRQALAKHLRAMEREGLAVIDGRPASVRRAGGALVAR